MPTYTNPYMWSISDNTSQIEQEREEYLERCRQHLLEMEQMVCEAEEQQYQEQLKQEEMKKYPLFFWKETCKETK